MSWYENVISSWVEKSKAPLSKDRLSLRHCPFAKDVPWSTLQQRLREYGQAALGLRVADFTAESAEATAQLGSVAAPPGLSLGDRACLALAGALGVPALTSDTAWARLDLGIEVQIIR